MYVVHLLPSFLHLQHSNLSNKYIIELKLQESTQKTVKGKFILKFSEKAYEKFQNWIHFRPSVTAHTTQVFHRAILNILNKSPIFPLDKLNCSNKVNTWKKAVGKKGNSININIYY